MLRSLRARLTLSYAVLVGAVLLVVTVALSNVAFQFLTRSVVESVEAAANDARRVEAEDPGRSFDALAQRIRDHVERPGVVVLVVPNAGVERGGLVARGGPTQIRVDLPPGAPPVVPSTRYRVMIAGLLGLHPAIVQLPGGVIVIEPDLARVEQSLRGYVVALAIAVVLVMLVAWGAARWITAQALAPLIAVTRQLQRFATGDFTPREISSREEDEIGQLAQAYNGAAAQVASAFEERRVVEEQMRRFVADASHELRTPLTVIGGFLDVLERGSSGDLDLRRRALETIGSETRRMRGLVDRLIALARLERRDGEEPGLVELADLARTAATTAAAFASDRVRIEVIEAATVLGDEAELHDAVGNLVDNALKYGAGSEVCVEVAREGNSGIVRVRDGGPGIPAAERDRIFERFYRGEQRADVEGSGLGLAIAWSAVRRAGGTLRLDDATPGHTVFTVVLPLAPRIAEDRAPITIG